MNRIEFESLMKVINYLEEDEQKNYEECETPDTMHIWNDIKVLMNYAQVHQFTLNNAEEALASKRRIDALHQSIHCELYEAELEAELEAKQWNQQAKEELDGELPVDNDTYQEYLDITGKQKTIKD